MDSKSPDQHTAWLALERLLRVARSDAAQAHSVADFLLALHQAEEDANWHTMDLLNVDAPIADDMLTVLRMVRESHRHPHDLSFRDEISAAWRLLTGVDPR
jgi:hypothetical protein